MMLGYGLWFLNDREVRYYKKRFKDWQDKVSFANADAFEKNERFEHALASLKKSHRDKQEREFDLHYYEGLILDLARENERKTEEERLSLADQLHDTVKQSLAIAKLKCDTLLMEFDDPQLKEVSVHLGQAIREARDVVQQMSLKILDEFGLETGLEDLVEQFRNHHGMRVKYVYDASSEFHCSLVMGKHIYHSVQECLNNVLKHGPLPEASVHIEEMGHQLRVLIKNTKGANKTSHVDAEDGGYGLFRIEQRCRQLGGRMDILDEASHFAVDMRLPLQEAV
jgi:signal transduction histidine kinase